MKPVPVRNDEPLAALHLAFRFALLALVAPLLGACATAQQINPFTGQPGPGYFDVSVEAGDTVSEIAQRYRVRTSTVVAMNRLSDPDDVNVGEDLRIPTRWLGHEAVHMPRPAPRSMAPRLPSVHSGAPPRPVPKPDSVPTPLARPATPATNTKFLWPVSGPVVSPYGVRPGGQRNDGINISVHAGAPIRAADAGVVTYAGNELRGYGNLVLIRHDNGYVTAYAHAERMTVQRGERVRRGQIIAYAGSTGDVSTPQLHFEIRHGTQPVDPRPYLVMASN